jgi:glyoxylase-like metal-dependent hydrolase (beta-lactamase superfamily II)
MNEIVPGIHMWSSFSEDLGLDFNGYAVRTSAGTVVVDPPDPGPDGWDALEALAPFEGIYVTNRNHSRAGAAFRNRLGVPIRMHAADAEQAEIAVDELVGAERTIGDEVEIVHVPGKSPGEIAFHVQGSGALVVGDLVIGPPGADLSTYPDEVIEDRRQLLRSVERLLTLDFDALLLCDGEPSPTGGKERLQRFVEATRAGPP